MEGTQGGTQGEWVALPGVLGERGPGWGGCAHES